MRRVHLNFLRCVEERVAAIGIGREARFIYVLVFFVGIRKSAAYAQLRGMNVCLKKQEGRGSSLPAGALAF